MFLKAVTVSLQAYCNVQVQDTKAVVSCQCMAGQLRPGNSAAAHAHWEATCIAVHSGRLSEPNTFYMQTVRYAAAGCWRCLQALC